MSPRVGRRSAGLDEMAADVSAARGRERARVANAIRGGCDGPTRRDLLKRDLTGNLRPAEDLADEIRFSTQLRAQANRARTERPFGNYGYRPEGYVLLSAKAAEQLADLVDAADVLCHENQGRGIDLIHAALSKVGT